MQDSLWLCLIKLCKLFTVTVQRNVPLTAEIIAKHCKGIYLVGPNAFKHGIPRKGDSSKQVTALVRGAVSECL